MHPRVTSAALGYATMEEVALQFAAITDRFEGAGTIAQVTATSASCCNASQNRREKGDRVMIVDTAT